MQKEKKFTFPNFPENLKRNETHFIRYLKFIEKCQNRELPENIYTEKHHLTPKSLGGSNEKENIIRLTGREHFIAHLILWKAFGKGMTRAFWIMNHVQQKVYSSLTAKQYERLRRESSKINSKRHKGNTYTLGRKHSQETILQMSQCKIGEKNPFYGKHHSKETKEKISSNSKEYNSSEEVLKKKRLLMKGNTHMLGKKHSEASREKISKATKGKKNPMFGKKHSKETKEKQSKIKIGKYIGSKSSNAKKVKNIDTGEIFGSMKEAEKKYNIHRGGISGCCKGRAKTTGGYKWEYVDD